MSVRVCAVIEGGQTQRRGLKADGGTSSGIMASLQPATSSLLWFSSLSLLESQS